MWFSIAWIPLIINQAPFLPFLTHDGRFFLEHQKQPCKHHQSFQPSKYWKFKIIRLSVFWLILFWRIKIWLNLLYYLINIKLFKSFVEHAIQVVQHFNDLLSSALRWKICELNNVTIEDWYAIKWFRGRNISL